jgi:hypothetical protein
VFEQRLADALHDAAVHLSFEQERIDGAAEVVDDGVALDGIQTARPINSKFRQSGDVMPEADRNQLEMFAEALLRHAGGDGYVSVRAFYEDDSGKPFRISPTYLKGGLNFLFDVIADDARRVAQFPKPVVFCPPLCTFAYKEQAREQDIFEGLALSVECDAHPQQARQVLEALLGPPTVVANSGEVMLPVPF